MSPSLRHGLYLGGFLSAYGLLFRLLDQHYTSPLGWVFYIALPLAVFVSLKVQANAGPQGFLNGLIRGSIVVAMGAAIYAIYVFVFNAFVDASLIEAVRADSLAKIDASDPKADAQIALTQQLTTPSGFAATIFTQLLIAGVVSALTIAPFVRRKSSAA